MKKKCGSCSYCVPRTCDELTDYECQYFALSAAKWPQWLTREHRVEIVDLDQPAEKCACFDAREEDLP